jgi:hypothetical protein
MAFIPGKTTGISPQVMVGSGAVAGAGAAGNTGVTPSRSSAELGVIDGTPVRVVVLAFAAAAGLWALRIAGFRFNIGVSTGR